MDEARRVLARLERIERLREEGVQPSSLLGEVRSLLAEGEAWISAEGARGDGARAALDRLAASLDGGPSPPAA